VETRQGHSCSQSQESVLPPEEAISSAPPPLTSVKGKCLEKYALLEPGKVREMFIQAGLERMHQRSLLILHDMIKNGMTNAFLNRLFDSCGFKRNRAAFRSLLGRLLEKYTEEEFTSFFEPLIWGESGLLPAGSSGGVPEELVENAKTIWERWWYLRKDSPESLKWSRDGGRPLNSPERRIAGLCLFLRKFGMNPLPLWLHKLRTASSAVVFSKELLASLILNDDFWNSHTTFRAGRLKYPAAVVGGEKARELAVDIIMPSLRAAAMLEKDEKMMDRIDAVFRNLPKTQKNRVLTTALDKWFDDPGTMAKTLSDAASRQGVLQLYSNYCLKISCDCNVCLINNTMFSR